MSEWQRIGTAPRDGTHILGWDPMGDAIVVVAWWEDDGWVVCWNGEANPDCTHWQPLPEPPGEQVDRIGEQGRTA